jgi:aquaporin Z
MAGDSEVPSNAAKYLSEFVGTFLLVLTIGCNVLGGNAVWAGVSIASVLMVSVYALGGISGANFNPAVSLALLMLGKLDGKTFGIYFLMQSLGGLSAALIYEFLFWNSFNLEPAKYANYIDVGACEVLYTFMLVFVVLNVAASEGQQGNKFYGLAIGFVIIAGAYAAGPISGGCFNPAVAFAIDTASVMKGWGWCVAYMFYEFVGAAVAFVCFKLCRPEDFGKEKTALAEYMSEFLGTFMLVLTVGLNILAGSPAAAYSIAAALMCMIYATGDVSGAHFNPAVTFAIKCTGLAPDLTAGKAFNYVVCQFCGGIVGSWLATFLALRQFGKTDATGSRFPILAPSANDWAQILFAEVMFTFLLCYVVLTVACCAKTKNTTMYGLAIGSTITVGGNAIGSISGGSLNPAVTLGLSLACNTVGNKGCSVLGFLLYILFEIVGAFFAFLCFQATHAGLEEEPEKGVDDETTAVKA